MPLFKNHPLVEGALYLKRLPSEPRFEAALGVDVTMTLNRDVISARGTGVTTVTATIEARDAQEAQITPAMVALSFRPAGFQGTGQITASGTGLFGINTAFTNELAPGFEIIVVQGNVTKRATVVSVTDDDTAVITTGLGTISSLTNFTVGRCKLGAAGVTLDTEASDTESGLYVFTAPIEVALHPDPTFPFEARTVNQLVTASVQTTATRRGRATAKFTISARRPNAVSALSATPWIRGIRLRWQTPVTGDENTVLSYYLFRKATDVGDPVPTLTAAEINAAVGDPNNANSADALTQLKVFRVTGNSFFDPEDNYAKVYYYWLVAVDLTGQWTVDGTPGPWDPMASASPGYVEDQDFIQGSIDIATIAERDSVPNALAAGTITTTKLGVLNAAFDPTRFKSEAIKVDGVGTVSVTKGDGESQVNLTGGTWTGQLAVNDLIGIDTRVGKVTQIVSPTRVIVEPAIGPFTNEPFVVVKHVPNAQTVAWGPITIVKGSLGATFMAQAPAGQDDRDYLFYKGSGEPGEVGTIVGRNKWNKLAGTPGTGTISINPAATLAADRVKVTGTGTQFEDQLQAGDVIIANNVRMIVATITSDTLLTVTTPPRIALTGASFVIFPVEAPAGTFEADFDEATDLLLGFNNGGIFSPSFTGTFISGDYLQTGAIDANKIDVNELSALTADLGEITAGIIYDDRVAPKRVIRLSEISGPGITQNAQGQPIVGAPSENRVIERLIDLAASDVDEATPTAGTDNRRFISVAKGGGANNTFNDIFYITASGRAFFSGKVAASEMTVSGVGVDAAFDGSTPALSPRRNATVLEGNTFINNVEIGAAKINGTLIGETARFSGNVRVGTDSLYAGIGGYQSDPPVGGTAPANVAGSGTAEVAARGTQVIQTSGGIVASTSSTTRPVSTKYGLRFRPVMRVLSGIFSQFDAFPATLYLTVYVDRRNGSQGLWSQLNSYAFQYDVGTLFIGFPQEDGGFIWQRKSVLPAEATVINSDGSLNPNGPLIRIYPDTANAASSYSRTIEIDVGIYDPALPTEFRVRVGGRIEYLEDGGGKITYGDAIFSADNVNLSYNVLTSGQQVTRSYSLVSTEGFLYLKPRTDLASNPGTPGEIAVAQTTAGQTTSYAPRYWDGTAWVAMGGGGSGTVTVNGQTGVSSFTFQSGASYGTVVTGGAATITIPSGSSYTLPNATTTTLGGVTVPTAGGLAVSSGALSINTGTGLTINPSGQLVLNTTGLITGSGTVNTLARWSPTASQLAASIIQDDGANVGIGVAPSASYKLLVSGSLSSSGALFTSGVTAPNLTLNPTAGNPALTLSNGTADLNGLAIASPNTAQMIFRFGGSVTRAASGAHPLLAMAQFMPPGVTGAGASVTDIATVYISGASNATVTGNSYALLVAAGEARFGSNASVGGTLTVTGATTLSTLTTTGASTLASTVTIGTSPAGSTGSDLLRVGGGARFSGAVFANDFVLLDGSGSTANAGPQIALWDEGTLRTSVLSTLRFVGAGVSATSNGGGDITVTIDGGSSGLATTGTPTNNTLPRFLVSGPTTTLQNSGITDNGTAIELGRATSVTGTLTVSGVATLGTGSLLSTSPAAGNNSTQIATTAYVRGEISALVSSAPATLDTLNELAAALGNDPNFATTTATALGNRLRIDVDDQALNATQRQNGRTNLGVVIGTDVQAYDADLAAIASATLTGNGNLRRTGGTWAIDTTTYLSANQTITLSGDVTGSGATTITTAISDATVSGKLLTGYTVGANTALAVTDSILGALGKLQGQVNARLTGNQTITVSGDVTGSGTTAIALTLATVNSNAGTFGAASTVPTITVNNKGLVTAVTTNTVIAPAGTLTGTTLASNVVSSSLTSVGTLTGLTVGGSATVTGGFLAGASDGSVTHQLSKAAHVPNSSGTHLELYAGVGAAGEVSMRFHQGNNFYHQIRATSAGFRLTGGVDGSLVNLTAGTVFANDFVLLDGSGSTANAGPQIALWDETTLRTSVLSTLRFVGDGVSATSNGGGDITVTIGGGSGGLALTGTANNNTIPRFLVGTSTTLQNSAIVDNGTSITLGRATSVTGTLTATTFSGSGGSLTSLNAGNVSSGTLAVAHGGTGVTTAPAALQLLVGQAGGTYALRTLAGSGGSWSVDANNLTFTVSGGGVTSFNSRTGAVALSSNDVTAALGYTPYNSTNPSGYITGITSSMVTTALGYTPYNSTNPSGYITSAALSGYLTTSAASTTYVALSGSYPNPSWITSLAAAKITGLAASATTDTTNAANITSGTLPSGRLSGSYAGISAVGTLSSITMTSQGTISGGGYTQSATWYLGGVAYTTSTSTPTGSAPTGALWVIY